MEEVTHSDHGDVDYEKTDANLKKILLVSLVSIVLLIGAVILVDNIFVLTKEDIIYTEILQPQSTQLRELRAHEDEVLNSYKLLDSTKGIYQIPIDRAMELIADEAYRAQTTLK